MQVVLPKRRNALILRNAFTAHSSSSSSSVSSTQFDSFHSTPISWSKWKIKWNSEVRREQRPSKSYNKYLNRQRRAEVKKALNDLLYKGRCSRLISQYEERTPKANGAGCWGNVKEPSFSRHFDKGAHHERRKVRREGFREDFDNHHETVFRATCGNRRFTWSSFNSWEDWESPFRSSTAEFEWREQSNQKYRRQKEWETQSEAESDDISNSCIIGSRSDRTMLGLPPKGPLKLEDVKNAFRSSALKWHPDKHQGPLQAMAEEKFKCCANAYKSLCNALSPV